MDDLHDYELDQPDPEFLEAPPPKQFPMGLWLAVIAVLLGIAGAGYIALHVPPRLELAPMAPRAAAPSQEATTSLGGVGDPISLPPLDETDAVVRGLVRTLSSNPIVGKWLSTDGLIRNFTVVVANIAEGATPAKQLRALRPDTPFDVTESGRTFYIDARSYHRYDTLAHAVDSIDPRGAARLYATLKPRIDDAYRDLGIQGRSLDQTLETAIVRLLETPVVDGRIRVTPKGIGYRYADDRLEDLTAAQRQLLRMGPENMRLIQQSLRRIAAALGVREGRLPPTPHQP
ncbi:MAG TPA: DUF3014 domain-containing protein [Vicinamibacterales bacterium]